MDTRFWGPSAWQLFHLVAFRSEYPDQFLLGIKDYLPCRFCRESTTKFIHENPLRGDPGKWLYDIHNLVNDKLRTQVKTDSTVVDPGPDPSFEEVKHWYMEMKPVAVPGRDYLFAMAANFSESPDPADMCQQRVFHHALSEVYPFEKLRKVYVRYLKDHEVDLRSRKAYMKWTYGLLSALSKSAGTELPPFKGYAHHVAYYRSGCSKKTYHGKTCRKLVGGGRTKDRDHRKTYRVSHRNLISS